MKVSAAGDGDCNSTRAVTNIVTTAAKVLTTISLLLRAPTQGGVEASTLFGVQEVVEASTLTEALGMQEVEASTLPGTRGARDVAASSFTQAQEVAA